MAKSKKYYVVWKGHQPGVYDSWPECQKQILNFPGAIYKSFKSERDASNAFLASFDKHVGTSSKPKKKKSVIRTTGQIVYPSISVDAACSGNPGLTEYQGVDTRSKDLIFRQGPYEDGTNNIGEFLALVHALALYHKKYPTLSIYTDSRTAQAWVRNKKAKTTLAKTSKNGILFDLIKRAEDWLKTNSYTNPILKWDTKNWGEIPADFGRK